MTTISDAAAQALYGAVCHKGKNKGLLLARAPESRSLAYAAWQAAMMTCNPYKVSIAGLIFMSEEQRAIYTELDKLFTANPQWRGLDRDRSALETLGVW